MWFTNQSTAVALALTLGVSGLCLAFAVFFEVLRTIPLPRWIHGLPGAPHLARFKSLIFRHSDDGRCYPDWGVVHFKAKRVFGVELLPD